MIDNKSIFKRIVTVSLFNLFVLFLLIFSIFKLSKNENLERVSSNKNFCKLKVKNMRGMIYDCRGIPLIEIEKQLLAMVIPNKCDFKSIIKFISDEKKEDFILNFKKNTPFVVEVNKKIKGEGIQVFEVVNQKFDSCFLCHVLGYVSNDHGVCGIEKSFDEHLNDVNNIDVEYQRNALGKVILNEKMNLEKKSYVNLCGVQLCIDKRIQEIVEDVANKYISNGAVILTEVPNCEIRASVSFPRFSRSSVKNLLNSKNSDLVNKVNYSYNLGSIFKLVTSACLIESKLEKNLHYDCNGFFRFDDGTKIKCFNGIPHKKLDLEHAVSFSCNSMFANFSRYIDPKFYLSFTKRLGFGEKIELAPGIITSSGNLPSLEDLKNEKKMAMFSFGQESLMATPVQVSAFLNLIASGGIYYQPKLVEKIINKDGTFNYYNSFLPKKVLNFKTTQKLKKFMKSSIEIGTSKYGNPKKTTAGAKTSTAETGMILNGKRVNQSWFAGFFPFEDPKYCVVILAENVDSGGKICGPVFKEISDKISELILS